MDGEGAPRVRREVRLSADDPCGIGVLATAMEPALLEAAGPDVSCVSISLEFAKTPDPGAVLYVEAWVERITRTLVFAAAEARADGQATGAASAIFSRPESGGGR